jgi:protein gp37
MGADSKIEWTHHTFNPWRGCSKVSEGCRNCYAETMSGRNPKVLGEWGPNGTRVVAAENGESGWAAPVRWDEKAKAAGERHRVFCASLADVFEDWTGPVTAANGNPLWWCSGSLSNSPVPAAGLPDGCHLATMADVRWRLWDLIRDTPNLDWLLLTKRPQNVLRFVPHDWAERIYGGFPPNVWLGVSVENQQTADERIPHLLKTPAAVRFLSCEPLLGPVEFSNVTRRSDAVEVLGQRALSGIHWVIVGGESGKGRRELRVEWVRSLVRQCKAVGVPAFVKQLGHTVVDRNDHFGGASDFGTHWPDTLATFAVEHHIHGFREDYQGADCRIQLTDPKGGDPAEWPADLRVREFPTGGPS